MNALINSLTNNARVIIAVAFFILSSIPIMAGCSWDSAALVAMHECMAAICVYGIFSSLKRPYSLFKVLNLFYLFFFCIAPMMQYHQGVCMLGTHFTYENYLLTSAVSLAVIVLTNAVYYWAERYFDKKHSENTHSDEHKGEVCLTTRKEVILILLSAAACFYALYINHFDVLSLFIRDGETNNRIELPTSVFLVGSYFVRPLSLMALLAAVILGVKHRGVKALLFLMLLIAIPPTGVARFLVAAMYLPVLMCFVPRLRRGLSFVLVICLGVMIVFPLLNYFRFYGQRTFEISSIYSQFVDINFDAYSMMMRVIKDDIVTNGMQLAGALLFWLPRSIWAAKPISSGYYVAHTTGLSWDDLSMPFWGEGYINFGYFGVIIFTVAFALLLAKLDSKYWCITVKRPKDLNAISYYILLGLLMFILRGSMMSALAYTVAIMTAFYCVKKIVTR